MTMVGFTVWPPYLYQLKPVMNELFPRMSQLSSVGLLKSVSYNYSYILGSIIST